jgi:hypothetical protein
MKNTIIQMSVALLLFFGIATSSQATFIHSDKAAGHYTGGWGSLNSRPLVRLRNFRQTYSATTGVHGLKLYFAWKMQNKGDAEVIPLVGGDSKKPNGNTPIPEPSIIALFGLGLFGLGLARRRIRK